MGVGGEGGEGEGDRVVLLGGRARGPGLVACALGRRDSWHVSLDSWHVHRSLGHGGCNAMHLDPVVPQRRRCRGYDVVIMS